MQACEAGGVSQEDATRCPHTLFGGAPHGVVRLGGGAVEDGDGEAFLRDVEREVLRGGAGDCA